MSFDTLPRVFTVSLDLIDLTNNFRNDLFIVTLVTKGLKPRVTLVDPLEIFVTKNFDFEGGGQQ